MNNGYTGTVDCRRISYNKGNNANSSVYHLRPIAHHIEQMCNFEFIY